MDAFFSAFLAGAIPVALLALMVWFARDWIFERLSRQLQHQYDVQLERIRADGQIAAIRNEIRYTRLHKKRAETIAEIYAALRECRSAIYQYTSNHVNTDPNKWEGLRVKVWDAVDALDRAFKPREIYIPASTADKLQAYVTESLKDLSLFQDEVQGPQARPSAFFKTWQTVMENLTGQSRILFEELREEFRHLLGDEPAAGR